MPKNQKRTEIGEEFLGTNGLDPFFAYNSSPRCAMMATHVGQATVVKDAEPRRILTGIETEFAKYNKDVRIPVDSTILAVIPRFPPGFSKDSIKINPSTTIIYEAYYDRQRTVGSIEVDSFESFHKDFGFRLEEEKGIWDKIYPDAKIAKDTIIASPSNASSEGRLQLGVEAEVAFMAVPGTIEDGFVASESFLKRMTTYTYHKLAATWGKSAFPLNLYGDKDNYKPFPDIGDRIRSDGLIFALRPQDPAMAPAEMTQRALMEVDLLFDRLYYGKPGCIVKDIGIFHDERLNTPQLTPVGMEVQAKKYYDAWLTYYKKVKAVYDRLYRERKKQLRITPEFNELLIRAQIFMPVPPDDRKLTRQYKLEQIDQWRVEVTYEKPMVPVDGFKFTDLSGGKGVICRTVPDEDMPTDERGNRAELIVYGGSTIKRMNLGRMYEQFYNAASRDLTEKLRSEAGLSPKEIPSDEDIEKVISNATYVKNAFRKLLNYYNIVASLQYDMLKNETDPARHVKYVLKEGIYLYIPPDNPGSHMEHASKLRDSEFCPHYGPVQYRNSVGEMVTTKIPVLIGSLYIIMLEKTGDDWTGVSSVKTQHHGVPAKVTAGDRHATPGREQPVRAFGESETRSYVSTMGPAQTMDVMDRSTSRSSHAAVVESILNADHPTAVDENINRDEIPMGGSRPAQMAHHFLRCRGIEFVYTPDDQQE